MLPAGARVVRLPDRAGRARGDRAAPGAAQAWFDEFALSPATQDSTPIRTTSGCTSACSIRGWTRWRVARRRLLPGNLAAAQPRICRSAALWPAPHSPVHCATSSGVYAIMRCPLGPALSGARAAGGARTASAGSSGSFSPSAALFNFALFIFFLLYNLFLLDLGFREDFVGTVNSALRVGSMAGHASRRAASRTGSDFEARR